MSDLISQYESLGSEPIAGDKPGGENVRLEEPFEAIEREIAKLDALTGDDWVRWEDVISIGEDMLTNTSKDLLVACYITRARCESDMLGGLEAGLTLMLKMVENFWDVCFPPKKRMRGRAAAFDWIVERVAPVVEELTPAAAEFEQIKKLQTLVLSLDSTLVELMGDNAPALNELSRVFKRHIASLNAEHNETQRKIEEAKPKAVAPVRSSASASSSPAGATLPTSISTERDLQNLYRMCQESLRSAGQYLRGQKISDAESYRINRFLTWLGINQLPPDVAGKTQLRPLSKEKMQVYDAMLAEKKYAEAIPEIENSLSRAPYWLDGHKIVVDALDELGAEDAATAVKSGLRDFVKRLPNVVNLHFVDDTPFANDETRAWINMSVMAEDTSGANLGLPISDTSEGENWEETYHQACLLMKEKQQREALQLFQDGCARSLSVREQSLWRYYQARFCFEHQKLDFAIPLLESLDRQLVEQGVENWEPGVSTKVIELLLRCYQALGEKEVPKERVERLHARLCQYDLSLAFDLSK
ncbi:type VI secretion system ImpA domain-containing protein [Gammaproteobacteria bacterium 45_16_T64]|nr:type VI secretion system ImpA domain-containing protein [Gammaproteobacteria bacterium 45_16_T64]